MRGTRHAAAAMAALAVGACDLSRPVAFPPLEEQVVLTSVLLAGDTLARVLLQTASAVRSPGTAPPFSDFAPLTGATVRLIDGVDTVSLTPPAAGADNPCYSASVHEEQEMLPGCYVGVVQRAFASGETYELIADLPGRGPVHGRTTIPAVPVIHAPSANAAIPFAESAADAAAIRIEWESRSADQDVELAVVPDDATCMGEISDGSSFFLFHRRYTVRGRTSADVSIGIGCNGTLPQELAGDILVTAFDTAYSRYARARGTNRPLVDAAAGFQGPAIGVFGSAASTRLNVVFTR